MYADGSRHTGQWHKNKKHGPAVFMSDNGRTFEGLFQDDAMLGKIGQVSCTSYWDEPPNSGWNASGAWAAWATMEYDKSAATIYYFIAASNPCSGPRFDV